jgi:hypothetical protein
MAANGVCGRGMKSLKAATGMKIGYRPLRSVSAKGKGGYGQFLKEGMIALDKEVRNVEDTAGDLENVMDSLAETVYVLGRRGMQKESRKLTKQIQKMLNDANIALYKLAGMIEDTVDRRRDKLEQLESK